MSSKAITTEGLRHESIREVALRICARYRPTIEDLSKRLKLPEEEVRKILKSLQDDGLITRVRIVRNAWVATFDGKDHLKESRETSEKLLSTE